jgi:hypothetical protein
MRVDFGAADHGNFSGRMSQRVAPRDRAGIGE